MQLYLGSAEIPRRKIHAKVITNALILRFSFLLSHALYGWKSFFTEMLVTMTLNLERLWKLWLVSDFQKPRCRNKQLAGTQFYFCCKKMTEFLFLNEQHN